jgi:hypothetical protein
VNRIIRTESYHCRCRAWTDVRLARSVTPICLMTITDSSTNPSQNVCFETNHRISFDNLLKHQYFITLFFHESIPKRGPLNLIVLNSHVFLWTGAVYSVIRDWACQVQRSGIREETSSRIPGRASSLANRGRPVGSRGTRILGTCAGIFDGDRGVWASFSRTEERLNSELSFRHEIYHLRYHPEDTMITGNLQGSIILCRLKHCVVFSFANDNGSIDDAMRATQQIAA